MSTSPIQYNIRKATRETLAEGTFGDIKSGILPKRPNPRSTDQIMSAFPFDAFADAKAACIAMARSWQIEADMIELDYHQPSSGMFTARAGWGPRATYLPVYFISYVYEKNDGVFTVTFSTELTQES